MHNVYIGIGTNIEPRLVRMHQAIVELYTLGKIIKKSSIYESEPFGFTEQGKFLNAVVLLHTELEIEQLHQALQELETELGRTKRDKWHEREIDFDLLFFDDVILHSESLTVPHSELHKRSFVLEPLAEIAPKHVHPVLHKNAEDLLQELPYEKKSIHIFE